MNKKIWITGSKGHMGSRACEYFNQYGYDVLSTDYKLDLTDYHNVDYIIRTSKLDYILNYAGSSNPKVFNFDDFANNILIVRNIVDAVKQYSPNTKCLFISSNKVFGDHATMYKQFDEFVYGFQNEETLKKSDSLYGKSKQVCDDIVRNSKISAINLIQSGVEDPSIKRSGFLFGELKSWIQQIKDSNGKNYSINKPFDSVYKEVMHINDALDAHRAAIESPIKKGEFVLGSGNLLFIDHFINTVGKTLDMKWITADKILKNYRAPVRIILTESNLFQRAFGWISTYSIRDIIEEMCQ